MNSVHSEDPEPYNAIKLPIVILSHGKESGPNGTKIVSLAEVARKQGYETVSVDYRGMDDPEGRVQHLLDVVSGMEEPFIFVGSSMGGYVSLRASQELNTVGLFLLAPAVGLPGYKMPNLDPGCDKMTIIHAWDDEIIPVSYVIEYAQHHKAELHLINSDHRLSGQIPLLTMLFDRFLTTFK